MRLIPASDEAKAALWTAYEALDEKQKRAITRHIAKTKPGMFKYWVEIANLVRGCDQRKVVARAGEYGARLDKALKEHEGGAFAAAVFGVFLEGNGVIDAFISSLPGNVDAEEFDRLVQENSVACEPEYAGFVAAFLKCYFRECPWKTEAGDATEDEMMGLLERLNEHAEELEEWASCLRLTQSLSQTDVARIVEAANEDVARLTELMRQCRETTGCPERKFKTPADVAEHVKELSAAVAAANEKKELADFLRALAESLRSLKVTHRSPKEETRLLSQKNQAVLEVQSAADAEGPIWSYEMDIDGTKWLRWAFEIRGEDLETVQRQLERDGYRSLSEFIGFGDAQWISDQSKSVVTDDKSETTVAEETGTEEPKTGVTDKDESEAVADDTATSVEGIIKPMGRIAAKEGTEPDAEASGSVENRETATQIEEHADDQPLKERSDDAETLASEQGEVTDTGTSDKHAGISSWESMDIRELARAVATSGRKISPRAVATFAGKLALQGEYALAYHLTANACHLFDMKGTIPAWVYGSVACGSAIQGTDQSANTILLDFFQQFQEQIFDELESSDRMATRLLLAAGCIEPALFFPATGAASILQILHIHGLSSFQAVVKGVAEYGIRGVGLPRAALFSTISAAELTQKRERVQAKAKEWLLERAPRLDIISRPGKDTWRAWISKSGPVGSMLSPLIAGKTAKIPEIRALAEKYAIPAAVDQEARRLFHHELKHKGDLLRPALNKLRRHTAEAIEIVDEWISAVESQPHSRKRFDEKLMAQLRKCFSDHSEEALHEIENLREESTRAAVCAGALACSRVVRDIAQVLKGNGVQSASVRNAKRLLYDDLMRIQGIHLDVEGAPRLQNYLIQTEDQERAIELAGKVVNAISTSVAEGLTSMRDALRMRGEVGDHETTGEILSFLEISEDSDTLKRLEQERTESVNNHRNQAREKLRLGQRALSDALTKGLYAAREYEQWAVQLEKAQQDLRASEFNRFSDIYALCDRLNEELGERKVKEIARMKKEINKINPSEDQKLRLDAVLNREDVHTATDYLDRIRNQIELPDGQESESAPFIQFFGKGKESACELIERELRDTAPPVLIDRVARKKRVQGLQLQEMQTTQAKEAADFLRLWFKTKKDRKLKEPNGSRIFNFFGLQPLKMVKVPQSRNDGYRGDVWNLQVELLESRDVCPSAAFGSGSQGHYKVVAYWLRPAAEDILQYARELGGGPVIVLYFGRMNAAERRNLAAEQSRGNVIVIDDILAVFLAGQRKGRLLSLFLCSLPFSHISPYTKAASLLPPEMFYGRHREIRQLMSDGTDSSCLLYGGRQIGKTVLLRHVQSLFERNEPNMNVATYIDLKGKEIGTNRPMDEVWLVIAEELAKKNVINEKVLRQTNHDWLFARVEEWLSGNDKRRILVLLDEADAFLAADAKGQDLKMPFSACTVLKDLMERTSRRFKIVFAGLHNVQKSTKVSNNPLAHFGEPICIGAMTEAGESREAELLITEPLGAAGFFFESADLPARILAQTNYYPNLIQIYCDELLKYMQRRSKGLFRPDTTPPYIIGAKILEDVYEMHELREELRLRFKWTLELDRRFELIANILALNDVECTEGLEVNEIQQNAETYWEKGFRTSGGKPLTHEDFRDLLEEMVGLGILRRAETPGYYALRNPNVLNLIGSHAGVERLLEDAHKWDPVEVYDPTKFRGQISEHDKSLRSPLNAAQESKLKSGSNQVCIVCGCPAGQVDKVEGAISYRFGKDGFVRVLQAHEDLSHFRAELSKLGKRKSGGTTLIVVPDSVRWDRNWIMEARKRVSRFQKSKGAVCVVLVTGPTRLFSIASDIVHRKFKGVNFISIQPWEDSTVNQWLQEGGHTAVDAEVRARLADLTGNWPVLLEEAVNLLRSSIDDTDKLERKVKEGIFQLERKRELCDLFGLLETTMAPLQFLCENDSGWTLEEISEFLEDGAGNISLEHVSNVLIWAELLGLARRGSGGWSLDAGVRQVLSIG